MKTSYQQLCIMFLCMFQSISAITLYNKSDTPIRFNIFKKNFAEHCYSFDPFPKKFGKISAHSFTEVKKLDPKSDYVVTFYDVYNCKNNKIFIIKCNTKKISFTTDDATLSMS